MSSAKNSHVYLVAHTNEWTCGWRLKRNEGQQSIASSLHLALLHFANEKSSGISLTTQKCEILIHFRRHRWISPRITCFYFKFIGHMILFFEFLHSTQPTSAVLVLDRGIRWEINKRQLKASKPRHVSEVELGTSSLLFWFKFNDHQGKLFSTQSNGNVKVSEHMCGSSKSRRDIVKPAGSREPLSLLMTETSLRTSTLRSAQHIRTCNSRLLTNCDHFLKVSRETANQFFTHLLTLTMTIPRDSIGSAQLSHVGNFHQKCVFLLLSSLIHTSNETCLATYFAYFFAPFFCFLIKFSRRFT